MGTSLNKGILRRGDFWKSSLSLKLLEKWEVRNLELVDLSHFRKGQQKLSQAVGLLGLLGYFYAG
jgi:hypothetical protein